MEKSMLVGDFILVRKINYGANIPNTPIFLPFMHQKIPGTTNTPSYSKIVQLGYNRLPGFQNVKNNDIVVFNSNGKIILVVECKSPKVKISQNTFDQISRYNLAFKSQYLMITNGLRHYFCEVDYKNNKYSFLKELPNYKIN